MDSSAVNDLSMVYVVELSRTDSQPLIYNLFPTGYSYFIYVNFYILFPFYHHCKMSLST